MVLMSRGLSFQRARVPEHKEQRRNDLIAAARRLLATEGLAEIGLSAIAREAGVAKSNVYRYFGSREEILLAILADDIATWLATLDRELAPLADAGDTATVARLLAGSIAALPRTCELIAAASMLEHHLTPKAAAQFKAHLLDLSIRVRNAIHVALPAISVERAATFVRYLHASIAGLWPMANPGPAMAAVVRDHVYACLVCNFEADLRGALHAMLAGLPIADLPP
jgi:AcrR family transcriptional regulator